RLTLPPPQAVGPPADPLPLVIAPGPQPRDSLDLPLMPRVQHRDALVGFRITDIAGAVVDGHADVQRVGQQALDGPWPPAVGAIDLESNELLGDAAVAPSLVRKPLGRQHDVTHRGRI